MKNGVNWEHLASTNGSSECEADDEGEDDVETTNAS